MAKKQAKITEGSQWTLNGRPSRIATVLWTFDGYVRFKAPWTKAGVIGKQDDSFRAHYTPKEPT